MPVPWVPGKAFNEVGFDDLEEGRFGEHMELSDYPKKGSMSFLHKDLDRVTS
jgi:hypothetical protein